MMPNLPYLNLKSFLRVLSQRNSKLIRVISNEVSTDRELGSIVKKAEFTDQPTVLFNNVKDSTLPVLMGLFSSREALSSALGEKVFEDGSFYEKISKLLHAKTPPTVSTSTTYDVVLEKDNIDLETELPLSVHVPLQGGRYISSGILLAYDEDNQYVNAGIYRQMLVGKRQLTVNSAPNHDLAKIIENARVAGRIVKAALVIGHHPSLYMASQFNKEDDRNVFELAGSLASAPFRVFHSDIVDFNLPSDAEILLEGYIDPNNIAPEGPFGEFTYFPASRSCPVMTIERLSLRSDSIYLDIHPTHKEHRLLGAFPARELEVATKLAQAGLENVDVCIPDWGAALVALISSSSKAAVTSKILEELIQNDPMVKYVFIVPGPSATRSIQELFLEFVVCSQPASDWQVLVHAVGTRNDPSSETVDGKNRTSKAIFNLVPDQSFPPRMDQMDGFSKGLACYASAPFSTEEI